MKIYCNLIILIILLKIWNVESQKSPMDYRYKTRYPPPPSMVSRKSHPPPTFMRKKIEQFHGPPRVQNWPRPIPAHQGTEFISPPVGPPVKKPVFRATPVPVPVPSKQLWKNPKYPFPPSSEKPFQSSQQIGSTHEIDYHVQTNNIPTNTIPIKQVGEKGPIHTIPAPNLSLENKPVVVEEMRQEIKFKSHRPQQGHKQSFIQQTFAHPHAQHHHPQHQPVYPDHTFLQAEQAFSQAQHFPQHPISIQNQQYQVTESNDQLFKNSEKLHQLYFQPEITPNLKNPSYEKLQNINFGKTTDLQNAPTNQFAAASNTEINGETLFELLKPHIEQQQQLQQTLYVPQHQAFEPAVSFSEFSDGSISDPNYKPRESFVKHVHVTDESNPQVFTKGIGNHQQVFTYDRHASKNVAVPQNEDSGYVTTNYNIRANFDGSGLEASQAGSPFIHEIYEQGGRNGGVSVGGNIIELNRRPTENVNPLDDKSAFYTTLPNQQVAETLASLQGSVKNNGISKKSKKNDRKPLEIYVSDDVSGDHDSTRNKAENGEISFNSKWQNESVDGYLNKDEVTTEVAGTTTTKRSSFRGRHGGSFGSKIKPKQSQ